MYIYIYIVSITKAEPFNKPYTEASFGENKAAKCVSYFNLKVDATPMHVP